MDVKPVFVRTPYNYDRDAASDETAIDCRFAVDTVTGELVECPSLTKQSFAEECDINTIVKRFGLTGIAPQGVRAPVFQDFEGLMSYQDAMNAIVESNQAFMEMPWEVRARFGNDPHAFVEFCSDDANRDEAVKLGLVFAPKPELRTAPQEPELRKAPPAEQAGTV